MTAIRSIVANGIFLSFSLIVGIKTSAQDVFHQQVKGKVYYVGDSSLLPGVSIRVLPQDKLGKTDAEGEFHLPFSPKEVERLVFSYPRMKTDTLVLSKALWKGLSFYMLPDEGKQVGEITVQARVRPTEMDFLSTGNIQKMGSGELLKAACCNLSESFETMPAVDVGFTDAISGYKQIQLLGLAGANTSFTRENIPDVRGLGAITGLTFTPGVWVESMQLSKGIGSVVNGYEGVAGQINVEWWKPFMDESPRWYLNAYQSSHGRTEGNLVYNHKLNSQVSTGLFLHGSHTWLKTDANDDGFLDSPMGTNVVASNRWFWFHPSGWEIQGGVKGVLLDQVGGQLTYDKNQERDANAPWGYHQGIKRVEGWAKLGRVYQAKPWKSMGLQLSGLYHDQASLYGLRNYDGNEAGFYANFIYQTKLGTTDHVLKSGASFSYSGFEESLSYYLSNTPSEQYLTKSRTPGVFTEYSYNYLDRFGMVAGLRVDHDNLSGWFVTPRLHLRYTPAKNTVLRASGGRAQRTVHVFAENAGLLASNRIFLLQGTDLKGAYHLKPEIAWNMGLSLLQNFRLNYRDGSFLLDYYYTHFQDQVIVDIEHPGEAHFYNLEGRSMAHSLQAQLDYEPIRKWDVRLAYRYYLIETEYVSGQKEKPLVAASRAFLNTGYETPNRWKFDYTLNWVGKKRVPTHFLQNNEVADHYSPDYLQMNLQVSKGWKSGKFEWYLGVENLTNYMQPDLILEANNPLNPNFDASLVWGPAMGRNIYTGFRWKIN